MHYKRGEVEDVDKYFRYVEEQGADRLLFEGLMKRGDFDQMQDGIDEHL